jgi:type I restriction enzyme S subunit
VSSTNGELPDGWEDATLGDLGEVIRGVSYKKEQARDRPGSGLLPLLRATNIGAELSFDDLVFVPQELVRPHQRLQQNDIVIAASSGSSSVVGKAAQLRDEWDGTFGAFCAVFRPNELVDPRYVALFMASPAYRARVSALAVGVNINNLKHHHILETPVPLPPTIEQQRIVASAESLLTAAEDGARFFASAIAQAALLRQALLQGAWEGAPKVRLEDLLAVPMRNGRSVRTAEDGFPVLRLTSLRNGIVDTRESKVGEWTAEQAHPFLIEQEDFLVARGNGSLHLVGRGGLVVAPPPPVAFPDTLIRIRPDTSRLFARYLRLVWDSPGVRAQIEAQAHTAAGIYKVNQDMLRNIEVPVPPLDEQQRIASELEGRLAAVDSLETSLGAQMTRTNVFRRSILHGAFDGTLLTSAARETPPATNKARAVLIQE